MSQRKTIMPAPIQYEIENTAACMEALARLVERMRREGA